MTKKTKEIKLPDFYFTHQVLWLRFTGIELLNKDESWPFRIYSYFILLFTSTYVFIEVIELKFHKDFDMISVVAWYVILHGLTIVKIGVIYWNRKDIGDLMRSFHKGFFKPDIRKGGELEIKCISRILGQSRFHTNQYGIFVAAACTTAWLSSLASRFTKPPENWVMPFIPMSLVDFTHSPTFEITCCYQGVAVCTICLWIYLCDCTVIAIMAQTVVQLKILEGRIRNYKYVSVEVPAEKREGYLNNSLHDTYKHHLDLLETVAKVEYLCSYIVLCLFVSNLILLCLVMYYTSMTSVKSIEFIRYVVYCFAIAGQVFLYCWWGNEMTLANEMLALTIFQTYDPYDPMHYAKALHKMLVEAQKPLFYTAGNFAPLSLDTYKAIIKGSFSYFTVLRQVNEQ